MTILRTMLSNPIIVNNYQNRGIRLNLIKFGLFSGLDKLKGRVIYIIDVK